MSVMANWKMEIDKYINQRVDDKILKVRFYRVSVAKCSFLDGHQLFSHVGSVSVFLRTGCQAW
jgi:hypothetical protein